MFFLVNKFHKLPTKQLKCMIVDFYDAEEIITAKEQLLSDVVGMKLNVDLPHIPRRRDGELMISRNVEDLLTVLTFLDENLKLNELPCYVTNKPDLMPYARLYEGDMAAMMKLIEKMQQQIENLNIALTAVASSVKQIPAVSAQVMARSVINQPTAQPKFNTGASAGTTSRDSHHVGEDLARDFPVVNDENSSRSWATTVETSSPVPVRNRYAALSDDGDGDGPFIDVRRSTKRARKSSQQQQQQQRRNRNDDVGDDVRGRPRRGRQVLCGKSSRISTQNFSAAKKIVNKAIYCVDNVSISVNVDDLCQFVRSMNVNVLSCFPAKPRRQQNESNLITDRKAFRLCIDAADKRKLLDESKWPDSIVISEWYYLNPASRMNSATTAASYAATSASASASASEAADERSEVQLPSAAASAAAMDTDMDLNRTVTSHDEDTVIYQDGVTPTTI